jgi:hypothetical protein
MTFITIAPLRQPIKLIAYSTFIIMGVLFGPGTFTSDAVRQATGNYWIEDLWGWTLMVGGVLVVGGSFLHRIDWALVCQVAGAVGTTIGLLIYGVSLISSNGFERSAAAAVLSIGMSIASATHGILSWRDLWRAEYAALKAAEDD